METTLDPKIQPFLYDHQIDGTPVLPGVMGTEAFAEAALCLLPGWHVQAIEEVNYLAPFKFYRQEARTLTVEALIYPRDGGLTADCRLLGRRPLLNQTEPQVTTHFTGRVRLSRQPCKPESVPNLRIPVGNIIEADDIYRLYFHGPAYQVVEKAWWDGNQIVGLMAKGLPNNHHPSELPTIVAPRLIELCFQTAGIWEMVGEGRMGLPRHIDCLSPLGARELAPDKDGLCAVVRPFPEGGGFDAEVVDTAGNCYLRLTGYRTVAVPIALDPERVKTLRATMSLEHVAA